MGKASGFLDYERENTSEESPRKRVEHWNEFKDAVDEPKLKKQAARCMDCGTPYCHTGSLISGAASGCPINNLIPEWNDLLYKGHWKEALGRLHKTNNFPDFTGRVCPAPCEGSCVLGYIDPPVAIKNIEQALVDKGFKEGWVQKRQPAPPTGKKVAIVGSGPAGLACADQLNLVGHKVCVHERADRAGGLLMYGIPNMKLEKERVVQRRVDLLEAEGVEFRLGVEVGVDIKVQALMEEFDALVLCLGATVPRDLEIAGRELKGVDFAMDFLTEATAHGLQNNFDNSLPAMHVQGKDVVVIGGGDTGTDCVGTSVRQGCKSLVQLEILPEPPEARAKDNPWPEWPKIFRMDYGQLEAKARFGKDPREYLVMTERFVGQEGSLTGIEIVDVLWEMSKDGRRELRKVDGTSRLIPAQAAFLAMGFLGPEQTLLKQLSLQADARGNIEAAEDAYATNLKGVFSAGDCRRGQSLVVWAIREGRGVARAVDVYLSGTSSLP